MLTILKRCAERMLQPLWGSRPMLQLEVNGRMTLFRFCSITFEPFEGFRYNSISMFTILRRVLITLIQGEARF